jgi:hypothetical protein
MDLSLFLEPSPAFRVWPCRERYKTLLRPFDPVAANAGRRSDIATQPVCGAKGFGNAGTMGGSLTVAETVGCAISAQSIVKNWPIDWTIWPSWQSPGG